MCTSPDCPRPEQAQQGATPVWMVLRVGVVQHCGAWEKSGSSAQCSRQPICCFLLALLLSVFAIAAILSATDTAELMHMKLLVNNSADAFTAEGFIEEPERVQLPCTSRSQESEEGWDYSLFLLEFLLGCSILLSLSTWLLRRLLFRLLGCLRRRRLSSGLWRA